MTPHALLDNVMWHCLSGPHAEFATGSGDVRRYAPGFSPIAAFRDPERPDFSELERHARPGEELYFDGWAGVAPRGWRIHRDGTMFRMLWSGPKPPEDATDGAVSLGAEHAARALELAELTHPGPFGPRTLELGDYFGYFADQRLVAMAGERLVAGVFREISGVCTHPEFRGRGFARQLTLKLVRRELERGQTPFLHVVSHNLAARALYAELGFRDYQETVVRIASRTA